MKFTVLCLAVAGFTSVAGKATADTSQISPSGFVVNFRDEIAVPPQDMWRAIAQLPRWWSGQHSYSGNTANMSIDLQAGGCWCERWGDGQSVQHGQVVLVQPGRVLRLNASLGPLQELAVNAVLTIVTSTQEGKHFLRLSYRVSGNAEASLDNLAAPVDGVLAVQFKRLKALAEKGSAE